MKKIMISQPMKGLTEEQIRTYRCNAVEALSKKGYEVVDSILPNYPENVNQESSIPIWYLSKSIEFMSTVDSVCFIGDWENARGCKIEHEIATNYGLEVLYL